MPKLLHNMKSGKDSKMQCESFTKTFDISKLSFTNYDLFDNLKERIIKNEALPTLRYMFPSDEIFQKVLEKHVSYPKFERKGMNRFFLERP